MGLPLTVEELTPGWLTDAVGERYSGTHVKSLAIEEIIWGTATKVLVHLDYADGAEPNIPSNVCVKGGFDPKLRGFALAEAYQREAHFYGQLAPRLTIPLPLCLFAGVDQEQGQGIVILENLARSGCSFGECTEAWPVSRVAAGVEVLARLHATTCGADHRRHAWLAAVTPLQQVSQVMLAAPYWDSHFGCAEAPAVPEVFLDRERMNRAFASMWQSDAKSPLCTLHGDPHIGNTYIDANGRPAFIDWQGVCAGPAIDDVAYFVSGALSVDDRRGHERDLLSHYIDALAKAGGPRLMFDDAWFDYRRFQLHGFLWATTSTMMQTTERIAAMTERHVIAMEDLECFKALGV